MNIFKRTIKKNALGKAVSFFIASVFLFTLIIRPLAVSALVPLPENNTGNSSSLAVTEPGYDDMGKVLEDMGYNATEIDTSDLGSKTTLSKYDAVYVNCSGSMTSVTDKTAKVVKDYVEAGGTLYTSDWADTLITKAFPGKVNFYGNKSANDSSFGIGSHVGISGEVEAKVSNSGLAAVLGKSKINVNFDMGSWAVIDSVGSDTKVLMKGPVKIMDYSAASNTNWENIDYSNPKALEEASKKMTDGKELGEKPLTVTFNQGKGRVLYTSFHNEAQNTSDMEKVLDWFAIWGKASKLTKAAQNLADEDNKEVIQEVIDVIDENKTKEFIFDATGEGDFKLMLNFGGSEISIKITGPDGKEVVSESITSPPFTESIDAKKGEYKVEVKGIDIPEKNYPFVLAAIGDEKALVTEKAETEEGAKQEEKPKNQFTLFGFVINPNDPIVWGAGAGIVILLLLIIMWVVKRRKKKAVSPNVVDLSGQNPPVQSAPSQVPPVQTPPAQPTPAVQVPVTPAEPDTEVNVQAPETPASTVAKPKKTKKNKK